VRAALLPLALLAAGAAAGETAYVSDELVLNVYSEENNQGQKLATLHSGAGVDTLSQNGEFTQVRLADGITGWVKTTYLTSKVPAVVRVKQLQEELERTRATTPALAEAAARTELENLKRDLALKQNELNALRAGASANAVPAPAGTLLPAAPAPVPRRSPWGTIAGLLGSAGVGFWLGYLTLARRVRNKFGGIKVY
jgi:Bacterial SH3 domain